MSKADRVDQNGIIFGCFPGVRARVTGARESLEFQKTILCATRTPGVMRQASALSMWKNNNAPW